MFLPKNDNTIAQDRSAEAARREGYANIESWVIEAIPVEIRRGVTVSVQEVVCGDPECAPIDVAVCILFPRYVSFVCLFVYIIIAVREIPPSEIMLTSYAQHFISLLFNIIITNCNMITPPK